LEGSGFFQVDAFNDATLALSIFEPGVYDLALLDIRMPGMNGFELFRKLRSIDNKIRICFLSAADLAYYRETDSDIINNVEKECFVSKPVSIPDLIERLKVMLSYR
jgi:DNA-binding response OmpR family regulator